MTLFNHKNKRLTAAICMSAAMALLVCELPQAAWAWRSPPPSYWRGPSYRYPTRRHTVIWHGRDRYYYDRGWFYRSEPRGLLLVAPPVGVIVPSLPLGIATLIIGGLTYYEWNGIYYRQVPEGYVVVDPPTSETIQPPESPVDGTQRVVVQSELLNVRSGPGLDQDIITQINGGTSIRLLGSVPDWYYVELNDGQRGWVMQKFVIPVKPVPQG